MINSYPYYGYTNNYHYVKNNSGLLQQMEQSRKNNNQYGRSYTTNNNYNQSNVGNKNSFFKADRNNINSIAAYNPQTPYNKPTVTSTSNYNEDNDSYEPPNSKSMALYRKNNNSQIFSTNQDTDYYQYSNSKENRIINSIISSRVGLQNLGNTCFMNTCLQNLIHSGDFINRLISKYSYIKENSQKTPITTEFLKLCLQMAKNSRGGSINPSDFKTKFGRKHSLFRGFSQNDTQEFCRVLLQDMNEELNEIKRPASYKELSTLGKPKIVCDKEFDELFRKRESSIVMDSFYGQIINIFTCKCGLQTFSFQKVIDLPLLLRDRNESISELLDYYFGDEIIKFETKCENCHSKTKHKKEMRISRPPNILILSLQRINQRTQRKNNCCISFPEELNIRKYIDEECGYYNDCKYSLFGIGNHSGTLNFGHYFAYIKLNDRSWHEFNDSMVTEIRSINNSSNTVYVLFYKKR